MDYKESTYHGYRRWDFTFEDRQATVVFPKEPAAGKNWLLKTEYFEAFPAFELEMVARGYHLAYLSNITRWYVEDDAHSKARFAAFLQAEFGLAEKCVPVGMSCGGMHATYFAAEHPERVAVLYIDAPVLNLLSCPCGVGVALDQAAMYDEFVSHTGKTVSDMINYRNHPIDRVDEIIAARIPVALVCGGSDTVVPYSENGAHFAQKYRCAGLPFLEITKPECAHHPHGLEDNTPLIEFVTKYYEC